MLMAIVAADDRLFAKVGGSLASPVAVYGLGYDANADGQFALDDNTQFDSDGFALSGSCRRRRRVSTRPTTMPRVGSPASGTTASRRRIPTTAATGPTFRSAWPAGCLPTARGTVGRSSPTFNFTSFAENPQPAPPPLRRRLRSQWHGDDSRLRRCGRLTFGSTSQLAADASGNGVVDAADYTIWRNNLGSGAGVCRRARLQRSRAVNDLARSGFCYVLCGNS